MKSNHTPITSSKSLALAALLILTGGAQAATVTTFTVNASDRTSGDNGSVTYPTNTQLIGGTEILTSITTGGVTYSNLVFADNATNPLGSSDVRYGNIGGASVSNEITAATDNRIDTLALNVDTGSEFEFSAAPTSLSDVFFVFEVASIENINIQLIDSSDNLVGNAIALGLSNTGADGSFTAGGGQNQWDINAVAHSMSDFGINSGQLSSVDGVRLLGNGVDLLATGIGVASTPAVPEPSATALLGLGGLALILRRRK